MNLRIFTFLRFFQFFPLSIMEQQQRLRIQGQRTREEQGQGLFYDNIDNNRTMNI